MLSIQLVSQQILVVSQQTPSFVMVNSQHFVGSTTMATIATLCIQWQFKIAMEHHHG
jgi:hypothetical protein